MHNYRDISLWKDIPLEKWVNWQWQIQNAITSGEELEKVVALTDDERTGVKAATQYLKLRISPHIAAMINFSDHDKTLRRQFIPSGEEVLSLDDDLLFSDVNADNRFSPIPGLIHRYPSKVLVFPSNYCGSYCRYCFRRKLNRDVETTLNKYDYETIFRYLRDNSQIEEVIFSGGDPLVIGDDLLEYILSSVQEIPHVQLVRLHTRMPVVIPYRITSNFLSLLKKYKPIFIVIHIDTLAEISEQTKEAISALVDNGIPCFASCPLLKDINDNESVLRNLWTELLRLRVKPYYLFHSDPVKGLRHFVVPIKRGLEIMKNLYDRMSGLAIPHYCFNVPNGGGHILLNYNYVDEIREGHYIITTFEGNRFEYFEN